MATLLSDNVQNIWQNLVFTKDDNKLYHTLTGSDVEITTLASNLTLTGTVTMSDSSVKLTDIDSAASSDNLTYIVRDIGGKLEKLTPADFCLNAKISGWHGHSTIMKVLPTEFVSDDGDTNIVLTISGYIGVQSSLSDGELYACKAIPTGYKATEVQVHAANSTSHALDIYSLNYTTGRKADISTNQNFNAVINITDEVSSDTNAIVIRTDSGNDLIYGATITLARV